MIASIDYIERKFNEYNVLCFEGKLKPLPFKLSNARTFLGQVAFMRDRNADGTWHYHDFVFKISNKRDMQKTEMEDTILHEMIHYWILSNQMQDSSPHGEIFIRKMKEINVKFNRNISVAHMATKEDHERDKEIRQHIICACRMRMGQRGVMVATKSNLFQLWDEIQQFPGIAEWKWFISTNPFFNRFPRAIKPKIYQVHTAELEEHLKNAKELIRKGNTIKIKG